MGCEERRWGVFCTVVTCAPLGVSFNDDVLSCWPLAACVISVAILARPDAYISVNWLELLSCSHPRRSRLTSTSTATVVIRRRTHRRGNDSRKFVKNNQMQNTTSCKMYFFRKRHVQRTVGSGAKPTEAGKLSRISVLKVTNLTVCNVILLTVSYKKKPGE